MLIAGLGGTGSSWGPHLAGFAKDYFVVLPDHRGTGRSTHTTQELTIAQHAADMAAILEHLDLGPAHIAGTSTGGAIAQLMALDYAGCVRSVVMTSSFARPDSYLRREFALRRKLPTEADARTIYECYALFLFSVPRDGAAIGGAIGLAVDRGIGGVTASAGRARFALRARMRKFLPRAFRAHSLAR